MAQMKQVKITEEKIKQLKDKKRDHASSLRDMNLKKSRIDEEIKNVYFIEAVIVDDKRNEFIQNGLVDLNRDALMNLIGVIQDEKKTRMVSSFNLLILYVSFRSLE
jgi:transposase